ncbi:MAG: hypothetical protein WD825_11680 [Gemmatimonadaceae bacterium]
MQRTRFIIAGIAFIGAVVAQDAPAQVAVQGDAVRQQRARPGDTYTGQFAVRNASPEPQEVKLYQTDYYTSADGTVTFGEPGKLPRSNAQWVAIGPSRVVVPPNQTLNIPFTVTVPAGQPLSGSYWSLVMVEGVPRGSAESSSGPPPSRPGQMTFSTRTRYAVAIITDVPIDARRNAEFAAPTVVGAQDSAKVLQFDVKNTGNVAFHPIVSVELYAADGTHVKSLSAPREMSYPGTSLRHRFELGRLPRGRYRAIVTVDAGDDALFGAQYTLNF